MFSYNACDFFMIRTPLLSNNDYLRIFNEHADVDMIKHLKSAFDDTLLKEALAIASRDLSEAADKTDLLDSTKASEKLLSSFVKYYIRASTRPTPFGLFAGVSFGKFADRSSVVVSKQNQHSKRARADMGWIYDIIKKLESKQSIRNALAVRFNDFTYANGNRLDKPNKTLLQQNEIRDARQELATSIRYTGQVKVVENLCKEKQLFSDIISHISTQTPNVPVNHIEAFIVLLLENEFLLSELRPPLINTDILSYLIRVLSGIEGNAEANFYATQLTAIRQSIAEYSMLPPGEGMESYYRTIQQMKELHESKNYLQVDMKAKMKTSTLEYGLKSDLETFISAMCKISPENRIGDEMAHYISLFTERYGFGAEVPVLELLDIDKGLGPPVHYSGLKINRIVPRQQKTSKEARLDALIERKVFLALRENKRIIEITDEDIEYISGAEAQSTISHSLDYLQSFELYLLAHPRKTDASYDASSYFTIAPAIASDGIGNSYGRFRDMLTEEESRLLDVEFKKQKELLSEYIIAEIAELPSQGRTSNVSLVNSSYDYQIMLTTNNCADKKSLSIHDLYISIDQGSGQFYIRSKCLNKKVIIVSTSMLNRTFGSNVMRFLREVSSMRRINILSGISSIINVKYEYSPRITYKRIVIKPETWTFSKDILRLETNDKSSFFDSFDSYRKRCDIPRYVFLSIFDNRLLLDLDNQMHVTEIYNALKKEDTMATLSEMVCDFDDFVAEDENGNRYVTEIVVPFILASDMSHADGDYSTQIFTNKSNVSLNCMQIDRDSLLLLPGKENWLFFKLYGCTKRQDELISTAYEALERLIDHGLAQKYFFVRYSDPEPHLRLRIQTTDGALTAVFEKLRLYLENWRFEGLIAKAVIDTYQRESERYGGVELIEYAEEYFFHESRSIMKTINGYRNKYKDNIDYLGISFVISVLNTFGLSASEMEEFLGRSVNHDTYRKAFHENKEMCMQAINDHNNWQAIRSSIHTPGIYELIIETAGVLKKYAQAVFETDQNGKLTNSIHEIVASVIHMFCNRFKGSSEWERKVYALTRHGLYALRGYLKHQEISG